MRIYRGTGISCSDPDTVQWLTRAADQDHTEARGVLGLFYATEECGLTKDVARGFAMCAEAVSLWQTRVDEGNACAQTWLGYCYEHGIGVNKKDVTKAVRLYQLAVDQGNAPAQNNLGHCYQKGTGVDKDMTEAVRLYQLAVDQGHASAQNNLGLCYENGAGVDEDETDETDVVQL